MTHAQTKLKGAAITKTFADLLDILCVAMDGYKVIHRYAHNIPWSFKFEKRATQFTPIDLIYMHVFQKEKPAPFHVEYNELVNAGYTILDILTLAQLSNGAYKRFTGIEGRHYAERKHEFEQRTGIYVS